MILSMLYDVNFIIGLLITLVLVTLVSFYFTQRIEEQNEKIGAMSVVVQALVKGLTEVKNAQQYVAQQGGAEKEQEQPQTIDLAALDEVNDLIEVSDDEEEVDDDASYQTKSIQIGESFAEEVNDINDINGVDEDQESESESSESSDSSDSESESSESSESSDIEELVESQEPLKETELFAEQLLDLGEEPEQVMYKTIHISLDDNTFSELTSTSSSSTSDYKKMSLSELRAIVIANNLCTDSSKMKKQQLYKLLGVSVEQQ